jgi:WD40 repeat protein
MQRRFWAQPRSFTTLPAISYLVVATLSSVLHAQDPVVFEGHEGPVLMGVYAGADNVATVSSDQTARLWNIDGQLVREYKGHTGPLFCLAVSGNGRTLVTGAQDNTARIWDVPQTKPVQSVAADSKSASRLALSPDGRWLVTVGTAQQIAVWDTRQWRDSDDSAEVANKRILESAVRQDGHSAALSDVAIRGDGAMYATSDAAGNITTWSPFLKGAQGHIKTTAVTSIVFRSNNQELMSHHVDGQVRIWKLPLPNPAAPAAPKAEEPQEPVGPLREFAPLADVADAKPAGNMVAFNGAAQLLTGSNQDEVLLTDSSSGQVVRRFTGLAAAPQAIACRADNQRVAAGGADGRVLIWNAGTGEKLEEIEVEGGIVALDWSPDNQKLAVATGDGKLNIFGRPNPTQTPQPGSELSLHQSTVTTSAITQLTFTRDSLALWSTHADGQLSLWSYASPVQLRQLAHGGAVYGADINADGTMLVTCSADRTVRIWNATTGRQRFSMSGHTAPVHAVAMSPNGSLIVSSAADKTIRLWDATGGRQLKQLATFPSTMYAVAFHPLGKLVAVAGADRMVHLIDVLTGNVVKTMEGHSDYVHCVRFNTSGNRLLSYGYAAELRVWDTASGSLVWDERVGRIGNYAVYSAEGTQVLLANGDGTARIFALPKTAH